jgi:PhoH-like ATPase
MLTAKENTTFTQRDLSVSASVGKLEIDGDLNKFGKGFSKALNFFFGQKQHAVDAWNYTKARKELKDINIKDDYIELLLNNTSLFKYFDEIKDKPNIQIVFMHNEESSTSVRKRAKWLYKKDKVNNSYIFKDSSVKIDISKEEYDKLIEAGELIVPALESTKDHSLVSCDLHKSRSSILVKTSLQLGETKTHWVKVITNKSLKPWDIRAKNLEQLYALYVLMEPNIKLITMMGLAGSGKTLLALAAGLQQTCDAGKYKKILVLRPTVSAGEEIGFLPGSLEEKMKPWMKPIHDNVEFILKDKSSDEDTSKADYLFDSKTIEIDAISFIRGRSIDNCFIIIDEAQNLNKNLIKLLISRAGSKSKVIVAGDIDQIDSHTLDKYTSGLAILSERFREIDIAAHVIFTKSERSKLAQLAAELL